MITAEKFIRQLFNIPNYIGDISQYCTSGDIYYAMREFAKMHVKETIKECIESSPSGSSTDTVSHEDVVEALRDCYPETNIK